MRFILLIALITGCARTTTQVTPPTTVTTAGEAPEASCGDSEPAPIEIKVEVEQPAKRAFDIGECR